MPVLALGDADSIRLTTAKKVFALGYGFEMNDAATKRLSAAKMIQHEPIRHWTVRLGPHRDMRSRRLAM